MIDSNEFRLDFADFEAKLAGECLHNRCLKVSPRVLLNIHFQNRVCYLGIDNKSSFIYLLGSLCLIHQFSILLILFFMYFL